MANMARDPTWLRYHLAARVCELGLVPDPRVNVQAIDVGEALRNAPRHQRAARVRHMTASEVESVLTAYMERLYGPQS